jgi:hypothetical protein
MSDKKEEQKAQLQVKKGTFPNQNEAKTEPTPIQHRNMQMPTPS